MYGFRDELNQLAERVRQGDGEAAEQLEGMLQPQLRRIVRRTLRVGADDTPLGRRILAEADRAWPPLDEEGVTRRVCQSLIEQLVRAPVRQCMRETILA